MQTTTRTREILSLAAYVPVSLLPEYVQEQIANSTPFIKIPYTDDNTECYICKEREHGYDSDNDSKYTVMVTMFFDDERSSETTVVELTDLTTDEEDMIDMLIEERVIESLRHIND